MKTLDFFKSQQMDLTSNIYGGLSDNNGTSSTSQCYTDNNDCKQVDCTDDCNGGNLECVESTCEPPK